MPVIIKEGRFIEDPFTDAGGAFVALDQYSAAVHDREAALTGIDVPDTLRLATQQSIDGLVPALADRT